MIHTTGAANHLDYGNVTELNGASTITLMWWWKIGTFTSDGHGVMGKGSSNPFRLIRRTGAVTLSLQGSAGINTTTGTSFANGALVHTAITLTSGAAPVYYANGVIETNDAVAVTIGAGGATNFLIGQEVQNNTDGPNDFGHFRFWNAILTQDEIKREMYSYFPQRTTNLILWSTFDDETQFGQYSPNSTYTMTQTGTVTQTTGGEPTFYGGALDNGQLQIPQRTGRRTQRPRRGAFRPFGKLIPRFQEPR